MATNVTPKSSQKVRNARPRKIKVGDRIVMHLVGKNVFAVVVEDRGHLGVNGRRILRIRRQLDDDVVHVYEVPEEEVKLASPAK